MVSRSWRFWVRETLIWAVCLGSVSVIGFGQNWLLLVFGVLVMVGCLLGRRRYPVWTQVAGGLTLGVTSVFISYGAGKRIASLPVLLAATTAHMVLGALMALLSEGGQLSTMTPLVFMSGFMLWAVALPAMLGRGTARRNALVDALRERARHLEEQRRLLMAEARLRERARIAVDMHDSLGHHLTLMAMQAGGLKVTSPAGSPQAEAAGLLHQTARTAMTELREIIGVLKQDGTPADVTALVEAARASGADVAHRTEGEQVPLPAPAAHAVHRVVQEGLTNALRHAPGSQIGVTLRYEPDLVVAEVVNGPATSSPRRGEGSGTGLAGLRDRVREAGGHLHGGPTPDGGHRLAAMLPVTAAAPPVEDLDALTPVSEGEHPLARTSVQTLTSTLRHRPVHLWLASAGVVLVSLVVIIGGVLWIVPRVGVMATEVQYNEARIGEAEDVALVGLVGQDEAIERKLAEETGGAPEGQRCRYFYSSDDDYAAVVTAFRFCFTDGRLRDKQRFSVASPY
ncbi:signal transduction histidine kinase [Crossiella equi]|uniref:histidine kinase n=1 Tax=Crossiella equi TaxID=130796 RepID=A0ABS5A9E1_9PSEU|nr:histidine kinase [Crossiella equi]MBP2472839.1 signal transduction histidine kinase [Crossiella equi]